MSRLVLIRVGDPSALWSICKIGTRWASPENHEQVVRNLFMEGYSVYGLFVGTGDIPLMAAKITSVRERLDDALIPESNELGLLKTVIHFDTNESIDLRNTLISSYQSAIDYARYKSGSQILIPSNESISILRLITSLISISHDNTLYTRNQTIMNPEYLINLNMNGC